MWALIARSRRAACCGASYRAPRWPVSRRMVSRATKNRQAERPMRGHRAGRSCARGRRAPRRPGLGDPCVRSTKTRDLDVAGAGDAGSVRRIGRGWRLLPALPRIRWSPGRFAPFWWIVRTGMGLRSAQPRAVARDSSRRARSHGDRRVRGHRYRVRGHGDARRRPWRRRRGEPERCGSSAQRAVPGLLLVERERRRSQGSPRPRRVERRLRRVLVGSREGQGSWLVQ